MVRRSHRHDGSRLRGGLRQSYRYLEETIAAIAAEHNPELDIAAASALAWSAVHGLAMLNCRDGEGPLAAKTDEVALHTRVEQFTAFHMEGFTAR